VHLSLRSFVTPLKEVKGLQVWFKYASSLLQECFKNASRMIQEFVRNASSSSPICIVVNCRSFRVLTKALLQLNRKGLKVYK
jgi:hypothetical protein